MKCLLIALTFCAFYAAAQKKIKCEKVISIEKEGQLIRTDETTLIDSKGRFLEVSFEKQDSIFLVIVGTRDAKSRY